MMTFAPSTARKQHMESGIVPPRCGSRAKATCPKCFRSEASTKPFPARFSSSSEKSSKRENGCHHRGTEDTEKTPHRKDFYAAFSLCPLCLCGDTHFSFSIEQSVPSALHPSGCFPSCRFLETIGANAPSNRNCARDRVRHCCPYLGHSERSSSNGAPSDARHILRHLS